MAEFCTTCAKKWGMLAEIDLPRLEKQLSPGQEIGLLCEGCGLVALRKDRNREVFYGYYEDKVIVWKKRYGDLV